MRAASAARRFQVEGAGDTAHQRRRSLIWWSASLNWRLSAVMGRRCCPRSAPGALTNTACLRACGALIDCLGASGLDLLIERRDHRSRQTGGGRRISWSSGVAGGLQRSMRLVNWACRQRGRRVRKQKSDIQPGGGWSGCGDGRRRLMATSGRSTGKAYRGCRALLARSPCTRPSQQHAQAC